MTLRFDKKERNTIQKFDTKLSAKYEEQEVEC